MLNPEPDQIQDVGSVQLGCCTWQHECIPQSCHGNFHADFHFGWIQVHKVDPDQGILMPCKKQVPVVSNELETTQ